MIWPLKWVLRDALEILPTYVFRVLRNANNAGPPVGTGYLGILWSTRVLDVFGPAEVHKAIGGGYAGVIDHAER